MEKHVILLKAKDEQRFNDRPEFPLVWTSFKGNENPTLSLFIPHKT